MDDSGKKKFYTDEFYKSEEEKNRRLREIIEKESILRREKFKLSQSQPWYKKSQNIITLLGVIIPLLASGLISIYNRDNKEISISYSKIERLISDLDKVSTSVTVTYDSAKVSNISKISFKIKNTGDVSLSKNDFIDGPIKIQIDYPNQNSQNFYLLDVVKRNDASQQNSELSFINEKEFGTINYLPSLLNKNDEVTIDAYVLNQPEVQIKTVGKINSGNVFGPFPIENNENKLGYKTLVMSLSSFFPFKVMTIVVLTIVFILSGLSSLFQFAMLTEKELEPKMGFFMALMSGLLSLFSLILLISVLVYV